MEKVYFSDLLPSRCPKTYTGIVEILDKYGVAHALLKGTNDIWCRDYMPTEVYPGYFVAWKYFPDYLLDTESHKASITDGVEVFKSNGIAGHLCKSDIIADGGNIIRLGYTTIMTSKVLEENYFRLPLSLLDELSRSLSSDIVLLPWDASEIYGHSDGIVRIVDSSTVIMTNYSQFDKQMAARFKKCLKVRFKNVRELTFLADKPYKNNWAYINWLETEKVLILPKFNVCEDEQALRQIEKFFPSYKGRIEMVDATDLIRYEGCLNCASWVINETVIQEDAWLLTQY